MSDGAGTWGSDLDLRGTSTRTLSEDNGHKQYRLSGTDLLSTPKPVASASVYVCVSKLIHSTPLHAEHEHEHENPTNPTRTNQTSKISPAPPAPALQSTKSTLHPCQSLNFRLTSLTCSTLFLASSSCAWRKASSSKPPSSRSS